MAYTDMDFLYTLGGYATLFGVGYAIYHVSTQKNRKRTAQAKPAKSSQQDHRKEDRKKKQRMGSFFAEEPSSRRQKPKATSPTAEPKSWAEVARSNSIADDGMDNDEFARQFAKAREGTKITNRNESGKPREKSVKQSRANQMEGLGVEKASSPSPTTGTDADSGHASAGSPAAAADIAGVADMLEPARAGPSILRLTSTGDNNHNKQTTRAVKPTQPVETKKQRQNRKKAEAAKAARQDAEKDRKVLEEKQRRTARISEGRPAKDGSQFTKYNGDKSAWNQGAPNGLSSQAAAPAALYAPLDTFEKEVGGPAGKHMATPHSENDWISSLPSEEEQLEMLKTEAGDWNTVKTKSSKKAHRKASSVETTEESADCRPAASFKAVFSGGTERTKDTANKNLGAFSALTTGDEAAGDAEEEWDV